MFGRLIPQDVWSDLLGTVGSHWFHRWFAFVVASLAVSLFFLVRRDHPDNGSLRTRTRWLLVTVGMQIALGVTVVWLGVPKWFALAHQGLGVIVFVLTVMAAHDLKTVGRRVAAEPDSLSTQA